jgi:ketosteroid isomerase-like protein
MRKVFSIPLLVVALAPLALGQDKNAEESGTAEVEQEILRLENEWMAGVVRRDRKVLDQLVADDFLLVSERWDGHRELTPKQPWIRNSLTTIEAKSFSYDKVKMQVRENMVVLHGLFTYEATYNGKPWRGTIRVTDVWVKEDGRWRVLARHASHPLQAQQSQ